ncbi:MAG: methyltransferase domain-containing protein [Eikenella sp.]|nr:methyltransferase domain-containing protein [Eikenella sp.]
MNRPSQHWRADDYARHARFVADYGTPLLDLLAPQAHERILDLGCGDGVLTRQIAAFGCDVAGFDGRAELVAAGVAGWLTAFTAPMLPAMPNDTRQSVLQAAAVLTESRLPQENGLPVADYVRLRVVAFKQ